MTEQLFAVTLECPPPWGFRLAGGIDFNLPLTISRVTPGGKASLSHILPNDVVLRIDGEDTSHMTHLDAQNKIKNCMGELSLTLSRGEAKIWKPKVTPMSAAEAGHHNTPPYKVSLKADQQDDYSGIGSSHNVTAKPFPGSGTAKVVHLQYNSPVGIYSAQNIAETFKGQTEGLITGVAGGEEPAPVDPGSGSYQAVHGGGPYQGYQNPASQSRSFKMLQDMTDQDYPGGGGAPPTAPVSAPSAAQTPPPGGFRSVRPPTGGSGISSKPPVTTPMCEGCDRGIVGPFVRVKGKSYHPECFVCTACHMNLKNQGYFDIGGKLYCEKDARSRVQPPEGAVEVGLPGRGGSSPASRGAPGHGQYGGSPSPSQGQYGGSPSPRQGQYGGSPSPSQGQYGGSPSSAGRPAYQQPGPAYKPTSPPAGQQKQLSAPHQYAAAARGPLGGGGHKPMPPRPAGAPRQQIQRGAMKTTSLPPGTRTPMCDSCGETIRGPFVNAIGKNWHPEHFHCSHCSVNLMELGFVEEGGQLFCENDYAAYFAASCTKCQQPIIGDVLNALEQTWHPDCFVCAQCHRPFSAMGAGSSFHVEDGKPYCEQDWNELFTTKCAGCQFPIEPGDKWVEALESQWHTGCFTCTICHKNLEGESFYAKGGRPYCRTHASS